LANSFGIDRRTQEFSTTLGELRKAVFAGGDFRISRSKEGLFLVTRGSWKFPDSEGTELLDRIAQAQTDIWRDRGLSGHLVFLLATDKAAGHWGGEGRTQAMVLELSRDTARPADPADGFAHELFHTSDFNAERLPYLQGFLLAAHWNTDGRTMDRVLRNLMKTNRNPLANQRIADALRVTGLANAGEEIERFVVRGETIQLRPRIWGECAAESALDVRQFDIGFDSDESKKTGIVQGVREGSNAWEAVCGTDSGGRR
jgi:predicted metalloprotease with PDZ domain